MIINVFVPLLPMYEKEDISGEVIMNSSWRNRGSAQ
jgi:hypothetical protein